MKTVSLLILCALLSAPAYAKQKKCSKGKTYYSCAKVYPKSSKSFCSKYKALKKKSVENRCDKLMGKNIKAKNTKKTKKSKKKA